MRGLVKKLFLLALVAAVALGPGCKKKLFYAEVPSGPESGRTGALLFFRGSATHPNGDEVAIRFDWGDGDTSMWTDWLASGETLLLSHRWSTADTYSVRAQAKDTAGTISDWSDVFEVTIVSAWTQTFGGAADDEGYAVVASADGGYVVAGHTSSFGAGSDDIYLVKTDVGGNDVWTKTFGGSGFDAGYAIAPTADGGCITTGVRFSDYVGYSDVCLVKTDASGNQVGGDNIGWIGIDIGRSVAQTGDGGYIVAGETDSYGAGQRDVYLVKADANCHYVWHKVFGGVHTDVGRSVAQTSNGGYIVLGETDPDGNNEPDMYLIRTDATGNQVWTKTFDGGGADHGYSVQPTSDGGFILAGQTAGGGGGYVYLIKTDADGNKVWAKTLGQGQSDVGRSVRQTADGGYVIAGATALTGSFDVYLLKTDANGDTLWTRTYGGSNGDVGYSVQPTGDGGYIVSGSTESSGAGGQDVWLIKTDSQGNVAP
jgi:hypothetical protein